MNSLEWLCWFWMAHLANIIHTESLCVREWGGKRRVVALKVPLNQYHRRANSLLYIQVSASSLQTTPKWSHWIDIEVCMKFEKDEADTNGIATNKVRCVKSIHRQNTCAFCYTQEKLQLVNKVWTKGKEISRERAFSFSSLNSKLRSSDF